MHIVDVAAGLVFRRGKLLITQRQADAHLGGRWEFPGGKREPNETFQECLELGNDAGASFGQFAYFFGTRDLSWEKTGEEYQKD